MTANIRPLHLLADSQLLFGRRGEVPFLESVRALLPTDNPKAAYIGASNGDVAEFFSIFETAMAGIGVQASRMIKASYPDDDAAYLEQADLILLAGGDTETGWRAFRATGMDEVISRRYRDGAVLIGTSAGAVQLGMFGAKERGPAHHELFETLRLAPFIVDVHDERSDWSRLQDIMQLLDTGIRAVGIPSGGGLVVHPDGELEPIRFPVAGFTFVGGHLQRHLLLPRHPER